MRKKTTELLDAVKRSRGKTRLSIEHIRELLFDAQSMGIDPFLAEAEKILSPGAKGVAKRGNSNADPIARSLEALQMRTGVDRKTFLELVVEELAKDVIDLKKVPKKQRTMPGLVKYYAPKIGAEQLEATALRVAEKHSRAH
jgi:hypothetical protein